MVGIRVLERVACIERCPFVRIIKSGRIRLVNLLFGLVELSCLRIYWINGRRRWKKDKGNNTEEVYIRLYSGCIGVRGILSRGSDRGQVHLRECVASAHVYEFHSYVLCGFSYTLRHNWRRMFRNDRLILMILSWPYDKSGILCLRYSSTFNLLSFWGEITLDVFSLCGLLSPLLSFHYGSVLGA